MRASLRQKIVEVCDRKIAEKGPGVGLSFYAFFANRNDDPELLMEAAESEAANHGRHVLVLDTATGSPAESIYEKFGWQRVGVIPQYALMPDGSFCGSTFFYKSLARV